MASGICFTATARAYCANIVLQFVQFVFSQPAEESSWKLRLVNVVYVLRMDRRILVLWALQQARKLGFRIVYGVCQHIRAISKQGEKVCVVPAALNHARRKAA